MGPGAGLVSPRGAREGKGPRHCGASPTTAGYGSARATGVGAGSEGQGGQVTGCAYMWQFQLQQELGPHVKASSFLWRIGIETFELKRAS